MFNAIPLFPTILLSIHVAVALQITPSLTPPPSIARASATYDWCDCRTGASYITIYPTHNKTNAVQINTSTTAPVWLQFSQPVHELTWVCSGSTTEEHSTLPAQSTWSIQVLVKKKRSWVWSTHWTAAFCQLGIGTRTKCGVQQW